mgnify:CR=1 FL=1
MNHSILRQHVRQWLVIALLMPAAVMAQNTQRLSLFETVDSPSQSGAPDPALDGSVPTSNSVQFVLVGTSQIGDRQRARLRSPDGQTLTVELNPLGSASIPGYPGYEVSRISARELEVRHPASTPCVPNREQGVTCAGTHQARLQLATAAPVVREQPATNQTQQVDPAQQNAADGGQPENPFAAALRAARERGEIPEAGATRADGARFRARRIDPADVPPGAQLIRTPFGDRIVVQ